MHGLGIDSDEAFRNSCRIFFGAGRRNQRPRGCDFAPGEASASLAGGVGGSGSLRWGGGRSKLCSEIPWLCLIFWVFRVERLFG